MSKTKLILVLDDGQTWSGIDGTVAEVVDDGEDVNDADEFTFLRDWAIREFNGEPFVVSRIDGEHKLSFAQHVDLAVRRNGKKLLGWTRYSHPSDQHLAVVLALDEEKKEKVCWVFNHSAGGLFWGAYGEKALEAYQERVDHNCMDRHDPDRERQDVL